MVIRPRWIRQGVLLCAAAASLAADYPYASRMGEPVPSASPLPSPNPQKSPAAAATNELRLVKTPNGILVVPPAPPPAPAAASAPGASGSADDQAAQEALRARNAYSQAVNTLNVNNPMMPEAERPSALPPASGPEAERLQKLQRLLASPLVQRYLSLFKDPRFTDAVTVVIENPHKLPLLYVEAGLFVTFLIFRAWRKSRAKGWLGRLWVSIYALVIYLVLGLIAAPTLIMGTSWLNVVLGTGSALMGALTHANPQKQ